MSLNFREGTVSARTAELGRMLEDLKRQLQADIQSAMQGLRGRAVTHATSDVVDSAEFAEADIQEELHVSLVQMKAETLERIDDALARLQSGRFGLCLECGDEISERRLKALPFALRCTDCETERESRQKAHVAPRRFASTLFDAQ